MGVYIKDDWRQTGDRMYIYTVIFLMYNFWQGNGQAERGVSGMESIMEVGTEPAPRGDLYVLAFLGQII